MSTPSFPSEWKGAQGTLNAHVSGAPNGPWTYSLRVRSPEFLFNGRLQHNTLELSELRIPEMEWRKLPGRRFHGLVPAGSCVTAHGYHERVDIRSIEFGAWDGVMGSVTCICECDFGSRNLHQQELVVFTARIEFTGVSVGTDRWMWTPSSTQHAKIAQVLHLDRDAARLARQHMRSHDALLMATKVHDFSQYQPRITSDAQAWFKPLV